MKAEVILQRGLELLKSKGEDYTEDREDNQYQNFERSNLIASWFKHDQDKSFAVLIGTKLARLASLLNSNKKPNNESVLDSFIDGANYFALWGGSRMLPTIEELDAILQNEPSSPLQTKSQEAESNIIQAAAYLSNNDLYYASNYLNELYKNRMRQNSAPSNYAKNQNHPSRNA